MFLVTLAVLVKTVVLSFTLLN